MDEITATTAQAASEFDVRRFLSTITGDGLLVWLAVAIVVGTVVLHLYETCLDAIRWQHHR